MAPRETIWPLDEHTRGKHLVLRNYLNAWLPILSSSNSKILFVDGFAGPGKYTNGEDGSPIIALKAFLEHPMMKQRGTEVLFAFIESRPDRAAVLTDLVGSMKGVFPSNCRVAVYPTKFDEKMKEVLDYLDDQEKALAPAFVMIDPFGVSDTPMSIVRRILSNPKSEVYISLMAEFIQRFIGSPEFEPHLTDLFGTDAWHPAKDLVTYDEKRAFLYPLYETQLRAAGAKFVLHFDLFSGNRLVYSIFFGTQHAKGCDRMKQAIWKVDPWGEFAFRGAAGGQGELFGLAEANTDRLATQLREEFANGAWVPIEDLQAFVESDRTPYHSGHLKLKTLKPMEAAGGLEVNAPGKRGKGQFPPGTKLRFL